MYHSIIIDGYNTYDRWHIVPSERPSIAPPQIKSNYIEMPAINGSLDHTEILNGRHYENRTGSWEFYAIDNDFGREPTATEALENPNAGNGAYKTWHGLYSDILKAIQGKRLRLILEDDIHWFYEGRLQITDVKTEPTYVSLTMEYNLSPRKYYIHSLRDMVWQINNSNTILYFQDFYYTGTGVSKQLNNPTDQDLSLRIFTDNEVRVTNPNGVTHDIYARDGINTSFVVPANTSQNWTFGPVSAVSTGAYIRVFIDYTPGGMEF